MSSSLRQVFVELGNQYGTSSFIESTGLTCSDSVSHNRVQVLSIPVLLLNLQSPDDNRYVMCPAGQFRVNFWDS